MRLGKILTLALAAMIASPSVAADWRRFIPRGFDNGAFFDVFALYESDDNRTRAQDLDWDDTFLRERVTLFSNGYVYHPRFLLYHVSVSGALKQENYEASFLEPLGWRKGSGYEYDTRLSFLPEHPYNAELFAQRYEPLFREQAAVRRNDVQTRWGGSFRYRKKPYFFNAIYTDDELTSGVTSSDVRRIGLGGRYFKRYTNGNKFSVSANYNPKRFSNSSGLNGSSTEALFSNVVDLRRLRFSLNLSQNEGDQHSPLTGSFDNYQSALYGVLTAYLPMNFRSNLSYWYQDNASTTRGSGGSAEQEYADTNQILEFDIIHRLYQSLDTRYLLRHNDRTSQSGNSTDFSQSLGLNYTKIIPRGRVQAGIDVGRIDTDNEGSADVVNEPHPSTSVPGSFLLGQENAERGSIVISLRSPVVPFETVFLDEGVHYTVIPDSATFRIEILTLPPPFVVPGDYDVSASYRLQTGAFALRTDTLGYNARVETLDNLLTPYYSYVEIRSKETAGNFPGIPINATTQTAGILVQYRVLRARGEYQRMDWDVTPYRAWRAELQAVGSFSPTTSYYARMSYLDKYFPEGRAEQSVAGFTETTASLSGNVQKRFHSLGMMLSAGGSFARVVGTFESRAYSLDSSLSWKIGQMDLAVGASAYGSDTIVVDGPSSERRHQYYYLKFRRRLF